MVSCSSCVSMASGGLSHREFGVPLGAAAEVAARCGRVEKRQAVLQPPDQVGIADEVAAEGHHVRAARGRDVEGSLAVVPLLAM